MKKIINKITLVILTISLMGCSEPDNAIYDVFDGLKHGAVLRTLERVSTNFNIFDLKKFFCLTLQAQLIMRQLHLQPFWEKSRKKNSEEKIKKSKPSEHTLALTILVLSLTLQKKLYTYI